MNIDLLKFASLESYVITDKNLKKTILKKLKLKNIGSKKLSKLLNIPLYTIKSWRYKNSPLKLKHFLQTIRLIDIELEDIRENIKFKFGRTGQTYHPVNIYINNLMATGLGILDGDGHIGQYEIYIGNTDIGVINIAIQWFEEFNLKNKLNVIIYPTINASNNDVKKIISLINYPNVKISKYRIRGNRAYIRVKFSCRVFVEIFKLLRPKLLDHISNNRTLKLCYIRGLFAAEGSCIKRKINNKVSIKMSNKKILDMVIEWLREEDIEPHLYTTSNQLYEMCIYRLGLIKKFHELRLASLHKDKERKIIEICRGSEVVKRGRIIEH